MTDVLTRLGALVAELQSIGCDVSVVDAGVTVTIRYPVPGKLDGPTARRIVDEVAGQPPAPKPRPTETRPGQAGRNAASRARAAQRGTCEVCGKEMSLAGLGPHRRLAHPDPSTADGVARLQALRDGKPARPEFTPDDAARLIDEGDGDGD